MTRKQIYIGRSNVCRGYVNMLVNKENVTHKQKAKLRAIHMATKSRPMKSLRNFQKRKYGTPPTIIGQHATRWQSDKGPIQNYMFSSPTNSQEVSIHVSQNDTPGERDNVFDIGEVLVFRGSDGLTFNLLRVTESVSVKRLGPRSNVRGDFLSETLRDDGNIIYNADPNWKNASMAYAHILRDGDDNAMSCYNHRN